METNNVFQFQTIIWDYYRDHKRVLPWRNIEDPYRVFVSEVMLQQTQVARVLKKYPEFLSKFPSFQYLAESSTKDLLAVWSGMGYNRRALYMRLAAQIVAQNYQGVLPNDPLILISLPGVGKATAGSLATFAYNVPSVFIETNIRRVFIHHFFADQTDVGDAQIYPLIEGTLDKKNPRDWYYALMDYGVMLSKKFENANKKSKHYTVQSKFEGSDRQIRGAVLRELVSRESILESEFSVLIAKDESRVKKVLGQMKNEGFIVEKNGAYKIKER